LSSPKNNLMQRRSRPRLLLPELEIQRLVKTELLAPNSVPNGDEGTFASLDYGRFAQALEVAILERLLPSHQLKNLWEKAMPVALGSWARQELTPKSDLDLLFLGDEAAAGELTRYAQESGIPIRSRVPLNASDLSVGVETFDVVALLSARGLTDASRAQFEKMQSDLIERFGINSDRQVRKRKKILSILKIERDERQKRSDSIAGFLEPNLKYGPGGLRDLGQALQIRALFPQRFENPERQHATDVYEYYRRFFLYCRALSQSGDSGGDVLSAHDQPVLSKWFGFRTTQDFMREVQKGLQRVSFYTDVDFAWASLSDSELKRIKPLAPTFLQLAERLEASPSLLNQAEARARGFYLYRASQRSNETEKRKSKQALGRILTKAIDPRRPEDLAIALFRSRWIDLIVTDFKKIVGHVQHDQYHRYTVDTHLLQAIREMKRVCGRPTIIGRLKEVAKNLNGDDWMILGWSALYHDVGKGSGVEHSDRSKEIAKIDLEKWGIAKSIQDEVIWLIENHLELSVSAFRGNPASVSMWRSLRAKGVEGKRLSRLAVFTCVDILATNREAYTPWKERLLSDLVRNLETPEAIKMAALEKLVSGRLPSVWLRVLDRLDPFVVANVPLPVLARDIMNLHATMSGALSLHKRHAILARIVRVPKQNRIWIRFHAAIDEAGLFYRIAKALQLAGLAVRHASLLSGEQVGVYDWVEIKPPRELKGLEQRLNRLLLDSSLGIVSTRTESESFNGFDSVSLLSKSDTEWILSFQGRDFRGALLRAVDAIAGLGLSIQWAKVHTWGRQIDDVFGVLPHDQLSSEEVLNRLRSRLSIKNVSDSVEV
jgi:[protein-PII] uridylyltransferase